MHALIFYALYMCFDLEFLKDIVITSKHGHNETCVCLLERKFLVSQLNLRYYFIWTVEEIFSQMDLRAKFNPHKKVYQIIQGAAIHSILFTPMVELVLKRSPSLKSHGKISYSSLFCVCLSEDSKHSQWWPTTMMCIEVFHNHLLWMGKRHFFFFILQICNDHIHTPTYKRKQDIAVFQG